jgi:hypothetical protein
MAAGFSRFPTIHPQRPSSQMLPAGSEGDKVKTGVRKMANNLRIVGRIQGGYCAIFPSLVAPQIFDPSGSDV